MKKILFFLAFFAIVCAGIFLFNAESTVVRADECSANISLDAPSQIVKGTAAQITACWKNGFDVNATIQLLITKEGSGDAIGTHGFWTANAGEGTRREYVDWNTGNEELGIYKVTLKAFNSETHAALAGTEKTVSVVAEITGGDDTGDGTDDGGTGGTAGDGDGDGASTTGGTTTSDGLIDLTPGKITSFQTLFDNIMQILQIAATIAALLGVIYGGINILQSGGESGKVANGKKILLYSLVGLVLAMFSKLIIYALINFLRNL